MPPRTPSWSAKRRMRNVRSTGYATSSASICTRCASQLTNVLRCTYSTHETQINPDGHCLFSAVADQLALLNLLPQHEAHYINTRHAAAAYMLAHPEDFAPFLPRVEGEDGRGASESGVIGPREYTRYCTTIRDTGAWGGEPEILALSRAYAVTIHVVQGGQPPVVVHDPSGSPSTDNLKDQRAVRISYHRRMYGLGEVRVTPRIYGRDVLTRSPDCSTTTRCDQEQESTRSPVHSKTFWPPHDGSGFFFSPLLRNNQCIHIQDTRLKNVALLVGSSRHRVRISQKMALPRAI